MKWKKRSPEAIRQPSFGETLCNTEIFMQLVISSSEFFMVLHDPLLFTFSSGSSLDVKSSDKNCEAVPAFGLKMLARITLEGT